MPREALSPALKRLQSRRIGHFQPELGNQIKNKINADNLTFICVCLRLSAVEFSNPKRLALAFPQQKQVLDIQFETH